MHFVRFISYSDSYDECGAKSTENFWKGFTIPNTIKKNICNLWEDMKTPTLTGVWKKLIPTLMADFKEGINCICGINS